MHTPLRTFSLSASALAVALLVSACGGGDAEPPPDTEPPTVAITDNVADASATGAVTFTFTFSEDVGSSFVLEDVLVAGGAAGALTKVSDTVYTLTVTPPDDSSGTITVDVAAAKFRDLSNNDNTAAASGSQAFSTVVAPPPPSGGTILANFDDVTPGVVIGVEGAEGSSVGPGPAGGGSGNVFNLLRSGGQTYALGIIETAITLTADRRTISAQVYSPTAGIPIQLKLEGGPATGDVNANETVVVGWQTLTWTLPAGTYDKMVLLPNNGTVDVAPGKTYAYDNLQIDAAAAPPPAGVVLANFDDVTPGVVIGVEGAEGSSVGPGPAGGGSGNVFNLLRSGGQTYALGIIETAINLTAEHRTISADVYSPTAGIPIQLKLEGGPATGDVNANETVVVGWQTLTWTFPAGTYNKLVLLPNNGTVDVAPGKTYSYDNIVVPGASGGGGGAFAGIFAADYVGDLFVNAKTAQGGDVGVFFDPRLPTSAAYDYAGVAGDAQNPGGVPNFYQGFGLTGAPITDAYYGAYVKAPGNATVDVSGFNNLKLRVWGPDQLFQAGTFPMLRVVLQTPAVAGCGSNSGGSEVTASFQTTTQGAASEYTLPLSGFSVQFACSGESLAQILANVAQFNILLEGTNIQYTNNQPGDAYGNGLNVGPIRFE
jgi:hypothetical protein